MNTKKAIDEKFENILWSRDIEKQTFPRTVTMNLAYPTQEAYDAQGELEQETILKAMVIVYHKALNKMFNEKIQAELLKPIMVKQLKEN